MWQMQLAFRIFGYVATPAQDFLFHLSSLLCAFPSRTDYRDASEGLFILVRVIDTERTFQPTANHHEHHN
nr:MAG TPA: hypothetical protein [Caudoviricetes sp.]